MARTKRTVRCLPPPTREEVLAGLTRAAVTMTHAVHASLDPPLTPIRCGWICKWMGASSGGNLFAQPVAWQELGLHDYPVKVACPMDLTTLLRFTESDAFDFAGFLDAVRLIWANACVYNPDGHPVNLLARRLASLFETKVVEAQVHAVDDDRARLSSVYLPFVNALQSKAAFQTFVHPVDVEIETGYGLRVDRPMCLGEICDDLLHMRYVNRYDVEADVARVTSNSFEYNGPSHPVSIRANELAAVAQRIFAAGRGDVDASMFVSAEMREQLVENVEELPGPRILEIKRAVETIAPDAIEVYGPQSEECSLHFDVLCLRDFVRVDTMVRRMVVVERATADDDMGGDEAASHSHWWSQAWSDQRAVDRPEARETSDGADAAFGAAGGVSW